MEKNKIILSFTADKETDEANTQIVGEIGDLLVAYTELSKALLKQLEETGGEPFARAMFAMTQTAVIEGSCLKKSYDEHVEKFKKAKPLMDIIGKTFKMPDEEAEPAEEAEAE